MINRLHILSSSKWKSPIPSAGDVGNDMIPSFNLDDLNLVVYYLQMILHLMQYSTNNVWLSLTSMSLSDGQ